MNIYVDFDDCLCETARYFTGMAERMFGRRVPYDRIQFFDLKSSFSLSQEQYEELMKEGHRPEVLLAFDETPGASEVLNSWIDKGYNVSVITGRPSSSYEPSRAWLDGHGLERVGLYCLNKYGRDGFIDKNDFSLEIEDYYRMHFDCAVEDSPNAFRFFSHLPELKVLVYDRPWNRDCEFPGEGYRRCMDWKMAKELVDNRGC